MSATATPSLPREQTAAARCAPTGYGASGLTAADLFQLQRDLGGVPLERIIVHPLPGTATEDDVVRLDNHFDILAELVHGTLVRKTMGYREGLIEVLITTILTNYVRPKKLGVVAGSAGMLKMATGNVRIPDVSFVRREDLPNGQVPSEPVPLLRLSLAVEVLSQANTDDEMATKINEYFESGSELIWLVNPADRTVRIYDAPDAPNRFRQITATDTLDGGNVLPGFEVKVAELFDV
ncbi:MAG: Uma2 family endonuclease [Planctomycetota bacterium]